MTSYTPEHLQADLVTIGLTQAQLARLLAVHASTVWRWQQGHKPVPEAVALLLETMCEQPSTAARILKRTGIR